VAAVRGTICRACGADTLTAKDKDGNEVEFDVHARVYVYLPEHDPDAPAGQRVFWCPAPSREYANVLHIAVCRGRVGQ